MKNWNLTTESFELFLNWLSTDREEAGRMYEAIRRRLLIFFELRGCPHAAELADETVNIVVRKIATLSHTYHGDPIPYFYGVARNQLRKYFSEHARRDGQLPLGHTPGDPSAEQRRKEAEDRCLHKCLAKLQMEEREIVSAYYREEKHAKIEQRKLLAERFGCTEGALRTRMSRLRQVLRECLSTCLERETFL